MSSTRRMTGAGGRALLAGFVLGFALWSTPAALCAQRFTAERAGIARIDVSAAAVPSSRVAEVGGDSTAHHGSRALHAVIGGATGLALGGAAGAVYGAHDEAACRSRGTGDHDLCGFSRLDAPLFALVGLVVGMAVGLAWPVH